MRFFGMFYIRLMPAPRPRMTRQGRAYMPAEYKAHVEEIRSEIRSLMMRDRLGMIDEPVRIVIQAGFKKPNKTKYSYPPRADVDNLAKTVLDAISGVLIADDRQVVRLDVYKQWSQTDHILLTVSRDE